MLCRTAHYGGGRATMTYREDIDGLRAIAVLSVILYHFKFTSFGGGYIGVDVFFVISGYLITGIIAREIEQGRFSFLSFYERRIRRIFPALFVVLLATAVYGLWGLYPTEYKELGGSIASTLAFASNFFFYSLSDYFRPDVEIKPLLHTWSLAVEEQYYLVFPLFLVLAYRYSRRLVVPLIVGIGLVSFALSVWLVRSQPAAAFYLSPPRFWEMLVGSFLALAPLPALRARWSREIVSILGLGAILASALFYKSGAPFPGFRALPPVLELRPFSMLGAWNELGRSPPVHAADGRHRAHVLFALSLALAHRCLCPSLVRSAAGGSGQLGLAAPDCGPVFRVLALCGAPLPKARSDVALSAMGDKPIPLCHRDRSRDRCSVR